MFSAYFLTCMLSLQGNQGCNVAFTEMPEWVTTQEECDRVTEQMHDTVLFQVQIEHPSMYLFRKEHGCYGGPLSAGEIARDEHAKLLNAGIDASLSDIP
ncbi:hypothetical protein HOT57_gp34 [Pseudomonas phage phCDa]|uniref:Uncharacterized protein n=1 Tax=Pseudomonas phage phCDa TaxID=2268587 RepID=A0A2Z5HA36_9CAUD|nr:hypothetical protein HOT57_gp34 [Pseudomonas phage phCDa]AXC36478.1 hypothetical protein phCDa_34 [Pseudomonas phage phCDa]